MNFYKLSKFLCYSIGMKLVKILSLSILLGSFVLTGCSRNNSSKPQSSETSEKSDGGNTSDDSSKPQSDDSSKTSGGDSANENPSDLPWIG